MILTLQKKKSETYTLRQTSCQNWGGGRFSLYIFPTLYGTEIKLPILVNDILSSKSLLQCNNNLSKFPPVSISSKTTTPEPGAL